MSNSSRGFSLVEGVLIVAILGVLAFVGYRVYEAQVVSDSTNQAAVMESNNSVVSGSKAISSTSDLDAVKTSLDSTDVDGSDTAQLNEQLDF